MRKTPLPYQRKVLDWALPLTKIPLFLQMRLGKTLITINWLRLIGVKRTLIICPKTVIPVWSYEIESEEIENSFVFVGGTDKIKGLLEKTKNQEGYFITNYEAVNSYPDILAYGWDCIVLDESTRIKNPKASISTTLVEHTKDIKYKAILAGCPAPESEMDYFQQMVFMYGDFMGENNFWSWRKRHFLQIGYDWFMRPESKQRMMDELKEKCYFLTRNEAGIERRKIYEKRFVFMDNPQQKKMYREIVQEFMTEYEDRVFDTKFVPVQIEMLCRLAGGFTPDGLTNVSKVKLHEILSLLHFELKGEAVVIWFKHNSELEFVAKSLQEKGIKTGVLLAESKEDIKPFQEGKLQVLCVQQKCGQTGIDLSVASTAIYYSNWWSNEMRIQSEDRILNLNKKDPLLYIDLICKYTIDEDTYVLLKNKKLNYEMFLSNLKHRMQKGLKFSE